MRQRELEGFVFSKPKQLTAGQERDKYLKHLASLEQKILGGNFNSSDLLTLIKMNKVLVERSFEREVAQERHDQILKEAMDSTTWADFN